MDNVREAQKKILELRESRAEQGRTGNGVPGISKSRNFENERENETTKQMSFLGEPMMPNTTNPACEWHRMRCI